MEKVIFLTCFVLDITREGGEGNFYSPPNHLMSIKKPNQNRVKGGISESYERLYFITA